MKLVLPGVQTCFQIDAVPYINTVVIERQSLFWQVLEDLYRQREGKDGKAVLSKGNEPISIHQNVDIIDNFIVLDLNRKSLLTKVTTELERAAVDEAHYVATQKLLADIEAAVYDWGFGFSCDIIPTKVSAGTLLRAVGIELGNDYLGPGGAGEKLIDYMELVREFDRDKLFVLVNARSFFEDATISALLETAVSHGYRLLMLENKEYPRLALEKRLVVDQDLCEI